MVPGLFFALFVKKNIFICIVFFISSALLQQAECAEKKLGATDKVIASTFKMLAKGFVFAVDLNKLKQENIARISAMKDEKYKRQYLKAFTLMEELPCGILEQYGLGENMTREAAIRAIRRLNKEKIYILIDAVPDALIAREFRQYLSSLKQNVKESDLIAQINSFWDRVVRKATAAEPRNN